MARRSCVRSGKLAYNGTRHLRVPSHWLRYVYQQHVGPIPEGHHIHHACGNAWCVEPSHLLAVTPRQHVEEHRYVGLVSGFNETAF